MNMDENLEHGLELYSQDGVLLELAPAMHANDLHTFGALSIVEYPNTYGAKGIEWRPNCVTIESVMQDLEWAVVNTFSGQRRERTLSECTVNSDSSTSSRVIRLKVADLKCFKLSRNSQQLTFFSRLPGDANYSFLFRNGNSDNFITILKTVVHCAASPKDKTLFHLLDHPDSQVLNQSFAELDLFTDHSSVFVWKFLKNFHSSPYVATMEAFSKLSDIVYNPPENSYIDEEAVAKLNRSLTSIDEANANKARDGYEVVECEAETPKFPPRPAIPRFKPLTLEQWVNFKDEQGVIKNPTELKKIIFKGGVSPQIRRDVWKYLLGYFPYHFTYQQKAVLQNKKVEEYFTMKAQWKTMTQAQEDNFSEYRERKSLIEKDVNRTDRSLEYYAGDENPHVQLLYDILMTYVMYNFDLGYVQGMSDLLSPILSLMSNEVDAFWCFVGFMNRVFRNFDMDQAGMKVQLEQLHRLVHFLDPKLGRHLDKHDSGNMFFCFRWLLVLFKREFSFNHIMYMWEVLWTELPCKNFHLLICAAILDTERDKLLNDKHGFADILRHINDLSMNIELHSTISKAEGIYHQIVNSSHLTNQIREILGLELMPEINHSSSNTSLSNGDGSISIIDGNSSDNTKEPAYEAGLGQNFL